MTKQISIFREWKLLKNLKNFLNHSSFQKTRVSELFAVSFSKTIQQDRFKSQKNMESFVAYFLSTF